MFSSDDKAVFTIVLDTTEPTSSATSLDLDSVFKASIVEDLHPIPKVSLDPERVQKMLTNLVFNAKEAMGDRGGSS